MYISWRLHDTFILKGLHKVPNRRISRKSPWNWDLRNDRWCHSAYLGQHPGHRWGPGWCWVSLTIQRREEGSSASDAALLNVTCLCPLTSPCPLTLTYFRLGMSQGIGRRLVLATEHCLFPCSQVFVVATAVNNDVDNVWHCWGALELWAQLFKGYEMMVIVTKRTSASYPHKKYNCFPCKPLYSMIAFCDEVRLFVVMERRYHVLSHLLLRASNCFRNNHTIETHPVDLPLFYTEKYNQWPIWIKKIWTNLPE